MKDDELKKEELETSTEANTDEVKFEENDNWKFDGVAHTLGDDFLSSVGVDEDVAKYETAKRPTKVEKETTTTTAVKTKKGIKNDKIIFTLLTVTMAIVIAVLGVLGSFYYNTPNSDERMNAGNVALTVGDTKVSLGMYNYYYTCISQNYISYANYYNLDTTKSYETRYTTDEDGKKISWADKFKQETIDQIQYITGYYEEAIEKGVTLTEKQKETIKSNLNSIKESATSSGDKQTSVDSYIEEMYGEGCGYATLSKMLEQCYIAENYYQQRKIAQVVTEEEKQAYFEKHADDYKQTGIAYLQIPYGDDYGVAEDKAYADAQKYAKEIKSVDQMKKLIPTACKTLIDLYVAQGYAEDADSCAEMLASNIEISLTKNEEGLMEEAINWMFDDATKVGDCKAFNDKNYSVIYIFLKTTEPKADDAETYSVRHILIMPESDSEDETSEAKYTDEQWAAAKKEADKILAEFEKGDKSEVSFAKLAEKYSDDTESTSAGSSGYYGGITEGVALGNMVKEYEAWATDKSRKYGDTGIVKSKFGYHIMFFIEDTSKYLYDCGVAIKNEAEDKFVKSVKVKEHKSVMKKVKVAQPVEEDDTATD